MTVAMWFAWLLRRDARNFATFDNTEAQREFVVWWLLYGRSEYPAVWWYGPDQVAVAMETVYFHGQQLPRLLRRVWVSRRDVQSSFPLNTADQAADLLCWYRLFGPQELTAAPRLPGHFLQLTELPKARGLRTGAPILSRIAEAVFASTPDLQRLIDLRSSCGRTNFLKWYGSNSSRLIPAPTEPPQHVEPAPSLRKLCSRPAAPLGVNLVGFSRAEFGIGEDVRSASVALERANVPHVILDLQAMSHVRSRDNSRVHLISDARQYNVTILCVTAFDTAQLYLERGADLFNEQYVVGYWPWELSQFPAMWKDVFRLVDEVWAATRFQMRAYQAATTLPVVLMPPAVLVPSRSTLRRLRTRSPGRAVFRFIMPFDPNSFTARKNPIAAIRAFRRAFPLANRTVELKFRVNGKPRKTVEWRALVAARRGDTRISFVAGTVDRAKALAMLNEADCLLSPHRAEGFGRNIAEAIALGVPVLATGYSGPADFLHSHEKIRFSMRVVAAGEYPFADGLSWADPIVYDLSQRMKRVRNGAPRFARAVHNTQLAGQNMLERLRKIYEHR